MTVSRGVKIPPKLAQDLRDIERLVVHGSLEAARARLRAVTARRVAREALPKAVSLARVAGLPLLAVRLLAPIVRPGAGARTEPTESELLEYAAALADLGGDREVLGLLARVSAARHPKKLLYEAWVCFDRWDHAAAVPLLERYVGCGQLSTSHELGGRVNLAMALAHSGGLTAEAGRLARAAAIFDDVLAASSPRNYRLHHKHALLGSAQVAHQLGRQGQAARWLEQLERTCLEPEDHYTRLRARHWGARIALAAGRLREPEALRELEATGGAAAAHRFFEVVRAIELFVSQCRRDERALDRLYFGTPHPAFRARVGKREAPASLLLGEAAGESAWVAVASGENGSGRGYLKEGQVLQRLLAALCADLYRPARIVELHERVFPDQYYNPASSPGRVYQGMRRLRAWLRTTKLPLVLVEDNGFYRLAAPPGQGCRLLVTDEPPGLAIGLRRQLVRLEERFGQAAFSAAEVARLLGVSHRQANLFLSAACGAGAARRQGSGPATRYQLSSRGLPAEGPGRS